MKRFSNDTYVQDFSAAFFMVEQLVASGSMYAVTDSEVFRTPETWSRIPYLLRKRIHRVNASGVEKMAAAILMPILDEVSAEGDSHALRFKSGVESDEVLRVAATTLTFGLPDFLLACRHKLHLDFPIDSVLGSSRVLEYKLRSPDARASVATLLGVFSSYQKTSIQGLKAVSRLSDTEARKIMDLFEDAAYMKMSAAQGLMGIPSKVRRASVICSRLARDLADSSAFRPVVNLTSKAVSLATKLPMPDSEIAALIARKGFMPSIVSLADERRAAREAYLAVNPPILPHPHLKLNRE